MAVGQVDSPAVAAGIRWLLANQAQDGLWGQEVYTGGGFPRVFYLRYHGYPRYFPVWALARYRNLCDPMRSGPLGNVDKKPVVLVTGTREAALVKARASWPSRAGPALAAGARIARGGAGRGGIISFGMAGGIDP
jgi:hypothetical protein